MKKFSIFLAIILGISMFAVTSCSCDTNDSVEQELEQLEKEFEKELESLD